MEEFDDEFGDLSGYKILSLDETTSFFKESKKLLQAMPNSSFEEISFDKKFGIENKCNEEKLGIFYHGQMRIDELISDLHKNSNNGKFFFNFGNYAVNYGFVLNKENPAMIKKLMKASYNDISRSTPYQYYQNQHRKDAKADIYLNMMACHVDVLQPGYIFYLDLVSQTIEFRIQYVYSNYINFRNFDNTTLNKRDYELNNKYNAIIVKAKNALDFVMLAKPNDENYLKEKIVNLFAQETLKAASQKEIKFLYENMPDFVTSKLLEKLGANNKNTSKQEHEDLVWNHLEILSGGMENQDLFSWNIDFSGAMLNLLKVFGNSKFLFEKFKSNQTFVKKIFENLEGESVINGEKSSNKIAFASFVSTLCLHNGMVSLRKIDKGFSFGRYNGVNSDDNLPREEKGNEFFLQKEKEASIIDFLPMESFNEIIPDDDTGAYYHPMDMVLLVDADSEEKYPDIAAAILIKAIADAHEEQEREKIKRIGFDILGIVLGAVALATSGNPIITAAAVSDVVVNTADTIVQGFDKDIVSLTGGEEFLQDWNTVYYSANIASAAIALPELFASGMKLIQLARTTGKTKAINFIKACIVKIILEKNIITFTGNTLKEGKAYIRVLDAAEAIKATAFFFNDTNLTRLYEKGVIIVEVNENGKKEFGFIYKNEVILQGVATDKNYKHIIYTLSRHLYHPFKMIERLEELRVAAFCKRMPKITNKFPTEELPQEGFSIKYSINSNGVFRQENGNVFPSLEFDFVITKSGELKIGSKHHFLGNRENVLAAGGIRFKNGRIVEFDNMSGHYTPTAEEAKRLGEILKGLEIYVKRARNEITPLGLNSNGEVIRTGEDIIIYIQNIK
ncbi:hypothetical protein [Chryseobacterium hagamense]|uniref:Uncharacterized protein n=1 Tax=Chryseobacterium hagamense TaxID=395935 RepID=A0A511YKM9_9FLAO|nr:hypothetical protein [Chryseobacterium hagamense]GEN75758.1 hypothetical protein CHA01nite_14980 [Chryseobacterium hagamense]